MKKAIAVILVVSWGYAFLLAEKGKNTQKINVFGGIYNSDFFEIQRTVAFQDYLESVQLRLEMTGFGIFSTLEIKPSELYDYFLALSSRKSYSYADDRIKENPPSKKTISARQQFQIEGDLHSLHNGFVISGAVYFLRNRAIDKGKRTGNALYRMNPFNWYDFVTGTMLDDMCDMGKGRLVGLKASIPGKVFFFTEKFRGERSLVLEDTRFRTGIHKLDNDHFFFHDYRLIPQHCAVEVYDLQGKRVAEFFDLIPRTLKKLNATILAGQTVVAGNGKGLVYVAFRFSQNPYQIWQFDGSGNKKMVFGNYFEDVDAYEYPSELSNLAPDEIKRWGIRKLYSIHRILIDKRDRILVFFTRNRFQPRNSLTSDKDECDSFVDVFESNGDYAGRSVFNFGFPFAVDDKNLIYCMTDRRISVVELNVGR